MTATKRGGERAERDSYYTPRVLAEAVVLRLLARGWIKRRPHPMRALEPSAGRGAFVRAIRANVPEMEIDAVDLQVHPDLRRTWVDKEVRGQIIEADFLQLGAELGEYDLVVGNPPFSDGAAEAHTRHALSLLHHRRLGPGTLAFLLPLHFLGGQARSAGLFLEHRPHAVWVLDKRPSFGVSVKCKRDSSCFKRFYPTDQSPPNRCPNCDGLLIRTLSDASEYGIFVWRGSPSRNTELDHLRWSELDQQWCSRAPRKPIPPPGP